MARMQDFTPFIPGLLGAFSGPPAIGHLYIFTEILILKTILVFLKLMQLQGLKLRKYFRGQVGPHQINFGSPHNLLGAIWVYLGKKSHSSFSIQYESKAKCKLLTADPLFLITVDSQKAFDIVSHIIMLDKMYETGVHPA
jgi:hypothetical protein